MSKSGASKEYERCVVEGYSQPLKKHSESTKKAFSRCIKAPIFAQKNLYSRLKKAFYTRKKGKNFLKRGKPTQKTHFCAKISKNKKYSDKINLSEYSLNKNKLVKISNNLTMWNNVNKNGASQLSFTILSGIF